MDEFTRYHLPIISGFRRYGRNKIKILMDISLDAMQASFEIHVALGKEQPGDGIKWKGFPRYWPFVRGIHRSPVNSPHKGQ